MSKPGDFWTHIRLRRSTLARLQAFAARLNKRHVDGYIVLPEGQIDRTSFDYAVGVLLDRDTAHFARMRRSRARKAQRSKNGSPQSCAEHVNTVAEDPPQ